MGLNTTVIATIDRDRHGHCLIVLDGELFNGFECNPATLRSLAHQLSGLADLASNALLKGKHFRAQRVTIEVMPAGEPLRDAGGVTDKLVRSKAPVARQAREPNLPIVLSSSLAAAKQALQDDGITLRAFAAQHGFKYRTVSEVVRQVNKGLYGEGHRVAVALGIK
jgi:gp16 family phage-associated protein